MKYTKDNVTYEADTAEELVALVRAFESPGDGGWIKWAGGECPVDGEVVYKVRDGSFGLPRPAGALRWDHIGCPSDIIAYRVVKP